MRRFFTWLLRLVCAYGHYGAGAPSFHGWYEAPVPEKLKKNGITGISDVKNSFKD